MLIILEHQDIILFFLLMLCMDFFQLRYLELGFLSVALLTVANFSSTWTLVSLLGLS